MRMPESNNREMIVEQSLCRAPVTSMRVEKLGGHYHVSIWVNHGKSGELVLREGAEFDDFMGLLTVK